MSNNYIDIEMHEEQIDTIKVYTIETNKQNPFMEESEL